MSRSRRSSRRGGARRPGPAAAAEGGISEERLRDLSEIALDPEGRAALDEDSLLLIVFQQCLFFAHARDAGALAALAELYPYAATRVGAPERLELLDRVVTAVEEGRVPVLALLPFLQHEPDPEVVALAAMALASLAPADGADDLGGPRALQRMAEHAEDEGTRVGLLAGLLQLGDRRVMPMLAEGWRALAPPARARLAGLRAPSPLAYACVAEFWLEALEDADERTFAAVAGALARMPQRADPPRVLDVRRKFPANAPDDRDEIEILEDLPLEQFARRIEPRLRDLARRENAPGRMADVLACWGLEAPAPR